MLMTALLVIALMGVTGIVFGLILAFANKKFAVEMNPLIHIVEDALPKGQCGACGFAGCLAYAEAVVLNPDVSPNLCAPGKASVAKIVAELTGKVAEPIESRVAQVNCAAPLDAHNRKYNYEGIKDCVAANMLHSGPKGCKYGCMGFGTCVRACVFDALKINEAGLPVVDYLKCTGCGKCAEVCPKYVISMIPLEAHVSVDCNSKDKGISAKKYCKVACIGCSICAKQCPHGAIVMKNNLPIVDSMICYTTCKEALCLSKCPTGAIQKAKISKIANK